MNRIRFAALVLLSAWILPASAGWQKPGAQKTFVFKKLPQTLWSQGVQADRKRPSAVTVYLPEDYSKKKSYPMVVYMGGARGESGHDVSQIRSVFGTQGLILVSLPLYKSLEDIEAHRKIPKMHELFVDPGQAGLLWSAYHPLLERVFDEVPNIDRKHTFFGGFSNGAHATAALLNHPEHGPALRSWFNHFYFVEGGVTLQLTMALPDASLLFMQGEKRAPWLEKTAEPLRWNVRIGTEVRTMPGVGHAFPGSEKNWLRTWVLTKSTEE